MKIKYFFLIICLFLLSGCSVDYHLNIDKDFSFNETVVMSASNEADISVISSYNSYLPINVDADDSVLFENKIDGVEYYELKKTTDNSRLKLYYDFDYEKFNHSMIANSCYQYVTVMKDGKDLILSTSREFLGFDVYDNLENVKVTLTSTYKLNETNADETDGHNYIWYITRENANNKYLYLSLDTTKRDLTLWEKLKEGEYTNIFTISVLLFLIGLLIYYILKKKGERRDKI